MFHKERSSERERERERASKQTSKRRPWMSFMLFVVAVECFFKCDASAAQITSALRAMDKNKPHIHIHLDENGQHKSPHLMSISSQNFTIFSKFRAIVKNLFVFHFVSILITIYWHYTECVDNRKLLIYFTHSQHLKFVFRVTWKKIGWIRFSQFHSNALLFAQWNLKYIGE